MSARAHPRAQVNDLQPGVWLAPSGAGKSYGAAKGYWLDGDRLIHLATGWPADARWYKRNGADRVHAVNTLVLCRYSTLHGLDVVLFNGSWNTDLLTLYERPSALRGVILPPEATVVAGLFDHPHSPTADARGGTPDARIAAARANIEALREVAHRERVVIIEGRDALVALRRPPHG